MWVLTLARLGMIGSVGSVETLVTVVSLVSNVSDILLVSVVFGDMLLLRIGVGVSFRWSFLICWLS